MAFDVEGARKAGYSDAEIADHLARSTRFDVQAARKAGYGDEELITHLNGEIASRRAGPGKTKRSLLGEAAGFMSNVNRGLGIGDEMAAGAGTVLNALTGRGPQGWSANLAAQREIEDGYRADHPNLAALATGTGNALTLAAPAGPGAQAFAQGARGVNALRGAVTAGATGAAYAAADRGTVGERINAAARTATDPLTLALGAGAGALATARRVQPKAAPTVKTDGDVLAEVGVSTSIPQRMGRAAKGVEDLLKRFPITGQAMAGYQDRQIGQLNRAVGLKALQPIGKSIPKDIAPGFAMVQYVDDELGKVYDQASKLAPRVKLDQQLVDEFAEIGQRRADLAESEAKLFDSIAGDRLSRLSGGDASGEMVKKIHGELGGLQAEAARKGQTTLASMLGDTRQALMGLIGRASPEAGKLIRRADQGWGTYSIMNDAAAAASARGGVFLPGQLNTQVRGSAKSMGSNMAGKGKGNLQDIATAASRTIPDTYGNPGTANAALLGAGGLGGLNAVMNPATAGPTIAAGSALTAAATPYMLMGRRVLESLPEGATAAEIRAADLQLQRLAARDPAVAEIRRELAELAARGAGATQGTGAGGPMPGRGVTIEFLGPADPDVLASANR